MTNRLAHTIKHNQAGEAKTRFTAIDESLMPADLLAAYKALRAKERETKEAAALVEKLAAAFVAPLTLKIDDAKEGVKGEFPWIPDGYAPVVGTRYDQLAVGAEPVKVAEQKAKRGKKAAVSIVLPSAPVATPVTVAAAPEMPEMPAELIRKGKKGK